MLLAIFLVYSIFGITSAEKVCRELKMTAILKILRYQSQPQFDLRYENIVPNYVIKIFSWWWRHRWRQSHGRLKVSPLYSFLNEITTFFMITKKRAKISWNFLCILSRDNAYIYINACSWRRHQWRHQVTKQVNFKIDISPSIFELERRSKAQNSGNTHGYRSGIFNFRYNIRWKNLSRPENGGHFENFQILNTAAIWPQIWKDRPKLC